jgi:hypothetical protein
LHLGKADAASTRRGFAIRPKQHRALDGRPDGTADQAVEPVVVASLRALLPFVHGAATAFRFYAVLGGKVFREETMVFGFVPEERQATPVAHGHREPSMDE